MIDFGKCLISVDFKLLVEHVCIWFTIATKIANHLSEFSRTLSIILQIQNIGKIVPYNPVNSSCYYVYIVCLWLNTIRCVNLAAAAKTFVDAEICMNILRIVGFFDFDYAATPAVTKLEVRMDDTWLTMDEFKLCHGILDQNWKSIEEAFHVTNLTFCGCVLCLCGIFVQIFF